MHCIQVNTANGAVLFFEQVAFIFLVFGKGRILLYSPGGPQICNPPVSAS
jgi:hypothetical protein